jgi:ubiquinone/menaquinone biosynthesis C-methylase UbiE
MGRGEVKPERWSDPDFVREWDRTTLVSSPIRTEQLDILTAIAADNYRPGTIILDLGCGTGRAALAILRRRPRARVVGLDASAVMVRFAERRLQRFGSRFQAVQLDLRRLSRAALPVGRYGIVMSALTLHEVTRTEQKAVIRFAQRQLLPGGLLLINDKFKVPVAALRPVYESVWQRLESTKPAARRTSLAEYLRSRRFRDGHPVTVDECLGWLQAAGFRAVCLHQHFNLAVIAAQKTGR